MLSAWPLTRTIRPSRSVSTIPSGEDSKSRSKRLAFASPLLTEMSAIDLQKYQRREGQPIGRSNLTNVADARERINNTGWDKCVYFGAARAASRTSTSDLALFRAQWRTCLLRRVAFHVKLALFFGHFWVKLLILNNLLALFPLKFALFYAFSCPAGRI